MLFPYPNVHCQAHSRHASIELYRLFTDDMQPLSAVTSCMNQAIVQYHRATDVNLLACQCTHLTMEKNAVTMTDTIAMDLVYTLL